MSTGGYDPRSVEPEIYQAWEAGGHFYADADPARKPFTIVIPPPNVTGALHLGHALNNTLQDILVRRKRMQGYNTCWLPGTDHAGIATQAVVEKRVKEEQGLSRHDLGREGLVQKIWEWKEEYNARILKQLRLMGCSCDWRRTRFTLDEGCVKAVYEMFFKFFKDGLIYRGLRLVNWDTQLQTAVADDEVYHETVKGNLWHIRYPIEGSMGVPPVRPVDSPGQTPDSHGPEAHAPPASDAKLGVDYLVVATTRPETMLADTAVAVHPDDERYKHLIGKRCILPLMNRPIPIIADGMLVKKEFGTGCVKVTPGHDPNDYACWQRHPEIGIIDLLTPDGKINDNGRGADGKYSYAGVKKEEARKKVVADLEALGLLEKVEPYETEVGHSDRSKTPIEPLRSEQWFVRMEPTPEDLARAARDGRALAHLAESAIEAVRDGRVQVFPQRYAKTYLDWLGEKRDWCISRQLWWGHRIPVWTKRMTRAQLDELISRDVWATRSIGHDESFGICVRIVRNNGEEHIIAGANQSYENLEPLMRIPKDEPLMWCVCLRDISMEWKLEPRPEDANWHPPRYRSVPATDWLQRNGFEQDPDVLDTWFSSALWPHSTFGWPEAANHVAQPPSAVPEPTKAQPRAAGPHGLSDLDYFYPTSVLSTAREIITLWVARMVLTGLYNLGRVPFTHVYIHPVVMDGHGQPMKKTIGNGVDPADIIEIYGSDALRFTLANMAGETQDIRMPVNYICPHCQSLMPQTKAHLGKQTVACGTCKKPFGTIVANRATVAEHGLGRAVSERFELGRNFCNKLWQAATGFILPTVRDVRIERRANGLHTSRPPHEMPLFEKWIRVKLLACVREVDRRLDRYEYSAAAEALRSFFWSDLCDWYIEEVKSHIRDAGADAEEINDVKITLLQVFDTVLALLHPMTPFVTEALWQKIGEEIPRHYELIWPDDRPLPKQPPALIVAPWPQVEGAWAQEVDKQKDAEREVDHFLSVIRALREIRTTLNGIRSTAKQPALRNLPAAVVRCDAATAETLHRGMATITRLGQVEKGGLTIRPDAAKPSPALSRILLSGIEVYVPIAGLADVDIELKRLKKERDELAVHIGKNEAKLTNEGFLAKAPAALVEQERGRLNEQKDKLAAIEQNLKEIGG